MSLTIGFLLVAGNPAPVRAAGTIGLLGYLDPSGIFAYTDVWGWVDTTTSREYALVGNNATGLHIIDVTDPTLPTEINVISTIPRFDIKTWGNLVYTVDGLGSAGQWGKITDISDPLNPVAIGAFPGAHNIFIDDQGFLYAMMPGLRIYDVKPVPSYPQLVFEQQNFAGHDATVVGDRLYAFYGEPGTMIFDVSDRANPIVIGGIFDENISYHHNGWPTEDGNYLFITDELAFHPQPDITVWDITVLPFPVKVAEIADSTSTVHNCYVVGDHLYVAYYTAGFHVYDISDPTAPILEDVYDTTVMSGEGIYEGSWGCYPFSPSGNVFVSDRPRGLFIFDFQAEIASGVRPGDATGPVLGQNYPNPFNPSTTISFSVGGDGPVTLTVHDVTGRMVRTLVRERLDPGPHAVVWDGRDGDGRALPSGVYFYRLRQGSFDRAGKMVLLQ